MIRDDIAASNMIQDEFQDLIELLLALVELLL
jgi:hypothetical protein